MSDPGKAPTDKEVDKIARQLHVCSQRTSVIPPLPQQVGQSQTHVCALRCVMFRVSLLSVRWLDLGEPQWSFIWLLRSFFFFEGGVGATSACSRSSSFSSQPARDSLVGDLPMLVSGATGVSSLSGVCVSARPAVRVRPRWPPESDCSHVHNRRVT
ncbi:hypothetical protein BC827DRAFT_658214 [Russula dissimulans]|nr:hypothetical protein BC827DRAFT_658214 [Russula dissimulans]